MPAAVVADWLRRPPAPASKHLTADACACARDEGVAALLYRALRDARLLDVQSDAVRASLAAEARRQIAFEAVRRPEITRVIEALASADAPPIVFKGAALAYSHYSEPWLRQRADTDLLIRAGDLVHVEAALAAIGYTRVPRPNGEHVTHQQIFAAHRGGTDIALDVHWKIADPQVFADVLSYDDLAAHAVPVPALGRDARAPDAVHALVIACTHRVAHHFDRERLQFICDIDRLARSLTDDEWARLIAIAGERRVRAVVARGLELADSLFGTPIPGFVRQGLARRNGAEPSAAYLRRHLRKIDILISDLRALDGAGRLRLIVEHLFPPRDFLIASTGPASPAQLPWRYVQRILRGARRWFTPLK